MRLPKFVRRLWMPLLAVLILALIVTIELREPFQNAVTNSPSSVSTKVRREATPTQRAAVQARRQAEQQRREEGEARAAASRRERAAAANSK